MASPTPEQIDRLLDDADEHDAGGVASLLRDIVYWSLLVLGFAIPAIAAVRAFVI